VAAAATKPATFNLLLIPFLPNTINNSTTMAGGRSKRAADPLTDIQPATKRRTRADYKENDGKSPHLPSHPAFM
jgi:hypothetical protein